MPSFDDGTPVSVGAFIRQAVGEGLGVTAARNAMRDAGVASMSNAAFGQLYGEVRAAVGLRGDLASIDYSAIPGAESYTAWAAGTPDRFATFVQVQVREIGTRQVSSRFYTYVTDGAHTPQAALDAAFDNIAGGKEDGTTPSGEVILSGVVTSMTRTVARAA